MTVETQVQKVVAHGNDSGTVFSFSPLVIFVPGNLVVSLYNTVTGVSTPLAEGTGTANYSVNVASYPGSGSITYPASGAGTLPTLTDIVIKRALTIEQKLDLENQGGYFPDNQEAAFDKLTMIHLQQQEEIDRCVKIAIGADVSALSTMTAALAALYTISANISTVAGISANVSTVASRSANIVTLAAISANITTVAGISANVSTVAGISANILTLSAISANISTVAGISSDVTSVAGISANVTTVAGRSANIVTLAAISANISTVAGISANVTAVAGISSANLNTVAGISANVITVAGISANVTAVAAISSANLNTVAGISANVITVAGISANVNTVAGISANILTLSAISANISTVAGISANISTVAGISANVSTVAGRSANIVTLAAISSNILTVAGISASVVAVAADQSNIDYVASNLSAILAAIAGGGDMLNSDNLAHLTNYTSARANLGITSAAATVLDDTTVSAMLLTMGGATTSSVAAVTAGLRFKNDCYASTTANLNATYLLGVLTNAGALAAFSTDGQSPPINSRILVKNQTTPSQNGIYTLTTVGSGAVAWVLTRATDYDENSEIGPGDFVPVVNGTLNGGSGWLQTATVSTVGTDSISFTEYLYPASSFFQSANNLSEGVLSSKQTNLGITSAASTVLDDTTVSAMALTLGITSAALGVVSNTTVSAMANALGLLLPQNIISSSRTTISSEVNTILYHSSPSAHTLTIDSNANNAWPLDSFLTIINGHGAGTLTIALSSDTQYLAGAGTSGNKTLLADGQATWVKPLSTTWQVNGVNLA